MMSTENALVDRNTINAIRFLAVDAVQKAGSRPSLIVCKTVIGYGSLKQATSNVHGEPLGEEGVRAAKMALGWLGEPTFYVPDDVLEHTRFEAEVRGELLEGWDAGLEGLFADGKPVATRAAGGTALNALVGRVHALTGGSADLDTSTKTTITGYGDFGWGEYRGHNMHFGGRTAYRISLALVARLFRGAPRRGCRLARAVAEQKHHRMKAVAA